LSDEGIYRLIEAMGDRITDQGKSIRVLNDHSSSMELRQERLETQLHTAVAIIKWVLAPMSGLTLLLRIGEMLGVGN